MLGGRYEPVASDWRFNVEHTTRKSSAEVHVCEKINYLIVD